MVIPEEGQFSLGTYVGMVDICHQFLAQDGELNCFSNFIAESLRKRPQRFVMHLAEMAKRE